MYLRRCCTFAIRPHTMIIPSSTFQPYSSMMLGDCSTLSHVSIITISVIYDFVSPAPQRHKLHHKSVSVIITPRLSITILGRLNMVTRSSVHHRTIFSASSVGCLGILTTRCHMRSSRGKLLCNVMAGLAAVVWQPIISSSVEPMMEFWLGTQIVLIVSGMACCETCSYTIVAHWDVPYVL